MINDELPLWSAPFGLMILETMPVRSGMKVLDIGSGNGFPMLEIAERLGDTSEVYGLDPAEDAVNIIHQKAAAWQTGNARIIRGVAEEMPFPDGFFDLIVANNGINNVQDQEKTLQECYRVSKTGARVILTVNLPQTMIEFYRIFEETLSEFDLHDAIHDMHAHILEKRKPVEFLENLIEKAGLTIRSVTTGDFKLRFAGGAAFLQHHLIRMAFLPSWKSLLPEISADKVFKRIVEKIDQITPETGEFFVTIPYACLDCKK
ncbi:MAG: methyltransferase domain-containing protein [Bacteroidales bacterium]|nr:methyltransferase domain-containing protein [Bacteroidales bacterium]